MKVLTFTSAIFVLLVLFILSKNSVLASDGTIELRSTTGDPSRCYAASLLMEDWHYTVIVSCRDLIYPGEYGLVNYVLWTQPTDGSSPANLGLLGYGKATFRTLKAFSSLFVTIEGQVGGKPTGRIVMNGTVNPVTFLERPSPVTPTPTPELKGDGETSQEKQDAQPTSTKDKLFLALKRAGIAALIALVALIGLIFVVTRARS